MRRTKNSVYVEEERLAESLVQAGLISEEKLTSAANKKQSSGKYLEEILVEEGWVEPQTILYFKENLIFSADSDRLEPQKIIKSCDWSMNISAKRLFQVMLGIICFLVFANLIGQLSQYYLPDFFLRDSFAMAFNIDGELNIPAVYSALTLLLASIILSVISKIKKSRHDLYSNYWRGLSIIFAFLFFDELASLHEKTMEPLRTVLNTRGFLYFAWVIPGSILVLIFLLIFLKFIANLPQKTRQNFLIAGTVYIAGAIGCELIGGYITDVYTPQSVFYILAFTLEEALEMLGIAIFIYGLLLHVSSYTKGTVLKIQILDRKLAIE